MKARTRILLQVAAVALAVAAVYGLAIRGDWIWDDAPEITQNTMLRHGAGLGKIWFAPDSPDYFPLKGTVQWAEWHLWGGHPAGYHGVSIALHLIASLLIWRVLARLQLRTAWWGAILFAVHPLAVESVAWISEMKNPLSLVLLLLATDAHLGGEDPLLSGRKRRLLRGLALACFLAAMLSKTTVAMFPLVLLLHAWWRRGRLVREDGIRAAPFFAVSLVLGAVTLWFQQHRAIAGMDLLQGGAPTRLAAAGWAAMFYLVKSAWPLHLIPIYPRWDLSSPGWRDFLPLAALAAAAGGCWVRRRTWGRHALLGFGWFLLNLVPVLGLAPMAYLRISRVADHFAYLPLVGLVGLAAAGLGALAPARRWLGGALVIALLGWEARSYVPVFQNEEALWTYTLAHNPESWTAHNDLGRVLLLRGRAEEARGHFERALQLNPEDAEAHFNLGLALEQLGRRPDAIAEYERALRIKPSIAEAHSSLGHALVREGRLPEAVAELERALRLKPDDRSARENLASARNNLGVALAGAGRWAESIPHYEEALRLKPENPEARYNLGNALAQGGRFEEAIGQFEASLRARPGSVETRLNLASALVQAGRPAEAQGQYERILRLAPQSPEAHNNFGVLLAESGRLAEARAQFEAAVRLKPEYEEARKNLARAQAMEAGK